MICIYKLTSPTNKIYIGQAIDFDKRMKRYKALNCKGQKKLFNSLSKYGFDKHNIEVIHELPIDISEKILNEYEKLYILLYKSVGIELLNLTDGGDGIRGYIFTAEDRNKLSNSLMGKNVKSTTKKKMSEYSKNRSETHKLRILAKIKKPVIQYDLEGNFIKEWGSLLDATSNNIGDIRSCINGRQKTAGGYVWEYKNLMSGNIKEKIEQDRFDRDRKEIIRRNKISQFQKDKHLKRFGDFN